jgi:hypothetical protein
MLLSSRRFLTTGAFLKGVLSPGSICVKNAAVSLYCSPFTYATINLKAWIRQVFWSVFKLSCFNKAWIVKEIVVAERLVKHYNCKIKISGLTRR